MKVKVCTGKGCKERFSEYILTRLNNDKEFYGVGDNLIIEEFQCSGNCKHGPTMLIDKNIHTHVTPAKASDLVFHNRKKNNNNKKK